MKQNRRKIDATIFDESVFQISKFLSILDEKLMKKETNKEGISICYFIENSIKRICIDKEKSGLWVISSNQQQS